MTACFSCQEWPFELYMKRHMNVLQVNYNLMAVNAFMAMTGLYQLSRKVRQDYGTQLGLGPGEKNAAA